MYCRSITRDPVFENNQDTYIFANILKSSSVTTNSDLETSPSFVISNSIIESVGGIINHCSRKQASSETLTVVELQERKIATCRRMHALSLFSLLRSWKITCPAADEYYQSVLHIHPTFSWKFYLCLSHQSQWSEYFIECSRQLPPNILAIVCNNIMDLGLDEDRLFYSYHILLQSIIWKLFVLEDPTILTEKDNLETNRFDFPFAVLESESESVKVQADNTSVSELLLVYEILLNKMLTFAVSGIESFDFMKLILHAYKLIFRLLGQVKTCNGEYVKEVFRLNSLLELCIHSDVSLKIIKSHLEESCHIEDPGNKLTSWKINISYLNFLVLTYWEEVEQLVIQNDSCLSKIAALLPCVEDRKSLMENSLLVADSSNSLAFDFLKAVVQYRYPCAAKAAEVLSQPKFLASNVIIGILENNIAILCSWKNYESFMNAIAETEVKDDKLLQLFYSALSHGPANIYNEVLKYILNTWGYIESFKLPDFDDQLDQLNRKIYTYEEAKGLLPLFVQSPRVVLQKVLQQALVAGPEGMTLVQVLKNIPAVCAEPCSTRPLISEVNEYFIDDSHSPEKLKNIELLIETLMEVNAEENILPFDLFMEYSFLPSLTFDNPKLELILSCLNAALRVLKRTNSNNVSDDTMMKYLETCSQLISASIQSSNGNIKQLVIDGLALMHEHFEKHCTLDGENLIRLHAELKMDPAVLIYMNQYVGQHIIEAIKSDHLKMGDRLWMWCCFARDEDLLRKCISQDAFSYERLLNTLVRVHKHFTMKEWIQSAIFIRDCCQHLHSAIPSNLPWKLSENNFHLYATIRCLTSCLYFILNQNTTEIHYISSCFTNSVVNLLKNQDVQPELLLYIFNDVCHLSTIVEVDILTTFQSFLMDIRTKLFSVCKGESQKKFMKLFQHSVKCLPDSDKKASLLEKISIKV